MVHCVQSMLRIFEFVVLLFDCFVCRQNITCLKRFIMCEVKDIIIGRLVVVS